MTSTHNRALLVEYASALGQPATYIRVLHVISVIDRCAARVPAENKTFPRLVHGDIEQFSQ